jgi:hypothetical protein
MKALFSIAALLLVGCSADVQTGPLAAAGAASEAGSAGEVASAGAAQAGAPSVAGAPAEAGTASVGAAGLVAEGGAGGSAAGSAGSAPVGGAGAAGAAQGGAGGSVAGSAGQGGAPEAGSAGQGGSSVGGSAAGSAPVAGSGGSVAGSGGSAAGGAPGAECPDHVSSEAITLSSGHRLTATFSAYTWVNAADLTALAGYSVVPFADGVQLSQAFAGGSVWAVSSNNRLKVLEFQITPYSTTPIMPAGGLPLFCKTQ